MVLPGGCGPPAADGPIAVSVIGAPLGGTPTRSRVIGAPDLVLRGAVGGGLVRFDQAGQIVPGVAVRWAIVEDGLDGIFRIDGSPGATAERVAARLRAGLAADRLFRDGIERVAAVTDNVVELRLAEPRSDLLAILARPELATLDDGGGAMRVTARARADVALAPRIVAGAPTPPPVRLRGERAGRAVAGFVAGARQLVLGGTFADLAVARAARVPRGALHFDPASGLFGLTPRASGGFYADPAVIEALSLAIDRDRIVALLGAPGAIKATTLAGSRIEPPLDQRRAQAAAALAGRSPPALRLALPDGPGARMLGRLLAQDWARLGIATMIVAAAAPADLALVDRVLPPGELARAACIAAGCDPGDKRALLNPPYIPIGAPLRWSLVAPDLDLFTENGLAAHPLDRLRTAR